MCNNAENIFELFFFLKFFFFQDALQKYPNLHGKFLFLLLFHLLKAFNEGLILLLTSF